MGCHTKFPVTHPGGGRAVSSVRVTLDGSSARGWLSAMEFAGRPARPVLQPADAVVIHSPGGVRLGGIPRVIFGVGMSIFHPTQEGL
jgi:hypothetical protein